MVRCCRVPPEHQLISHPRESCSQSCVKQAAASPVLSHRLIWTFGICVCVSVCRDCRFTATAAMHRPPDRVTCQSWVWKCRCSKPHSCHQMKGRSTAVPAVVPQEHAAAATAAALWSTAHQTVRKPTGKATCASDKPAHAEYENFCVFTDCMLAKAVMAD